MSSQKLNPESSIPNKSTESPQPPERVFKPSARALPFLPNPFYVELKSFNRTPRYLFRLYAPKTVGQSSTYVTSPAWNCGKPEKERDIFCLDSWEAAELLQNHLLWKTPHQSECNLMSWTSSLLFAIQYGLYRHCTDASKPDLSSISLLVVDTGHFPNGTFLRDLEAIETFKDYSLDLANLHKLRTDGTYYFGEYLTQGYLDIKERCSETCIQRMIDLGLFDLCPELGNRQCWKRWVKPVVALSSLFLESPPATESSDVRKAITIAQGCFGNPWALSLTAMLLSFKPRQPVDSTIMDGLRSMFTDKEIDQLRLTEIKTESQGLPEVEQYGNIIRDLVRHLKQAGTGELVNPFEQLSLK